MIRIFFNAVQYQSQARLEQALRDAASGMGEEGREIVKCRSCGGWLAMSEDEVRHDDPPERVGMIWRIKSCDECIIANAEHGAGDAGS